jgi:hypothetical protein
MHIFLMTGMVAISFLIRWQWQPAGKTWNTRWHHALAAFCLPPLLLLSASIAVLWMGHHGTMAGMPVSPVGCWVSRLVFLTLGGIFLGSLGQAVWFQAYLRRFPWAALASGENVRCIDSESPFIAQVGFLRSQIVVSRGWLDDFTEPEQRAILRHEEAHARYQDPFWFFWLGMVRRLTLWLPHTESLWQELLLLREIRADRWAAEDADPLLLAELLVKLARVSGPPLTPLPFAVRFWEQDSVSRLEHRVNALINPESWPAEASKTGDLAWISLTVLPLMMTWLHS